MTLVSSESYDSLVNPVLHLDLTIDVCIGHELFARVEDHIENMLRGVVVRGFNESAILDLHLGCAKSV